MIKALKKIKAKWDCLDSKQKKLVYVAAPVVYTWIRKKHKKKKLQKKYAECPRPPVDYDVK